MQTWNWKAQAESIRHIGPMAQDFYAAFHSRLDRFRGCSQTQRDRTMH
jgi:hypothetical protein